MRMNENTLYKKVLGGVSRFALTLAEDSLYHQQKAAEAYRAAHPDACVPPGPFIERLNARILQIVRQPASQSCGRVDGAAGAAKTALNLADHACAEIPTCAGREGAELLAAVKRIMELAWRYLEADSAEAKVAAGMDCAKALDMYGKLLFTKYGHAADISVTQLRILRTCMVADLLQPVLSCGPAASRMSAQWN
jgi:hypothetical protein